MSCMFPAGTPRIGLGLAALGRPGYINLDRAADIPDRTEQAMRGQAEKVLDAAWAQLYSGGVGPLEALLLPVLHTRLATRLHAPGQPSRWCNARCAK